MKHYSYKSVKATSRFALSEWAYEAHSTGTTYVLPDGCRDLIFKPSDVQTEGWFISDLDESPYEIETQIDLKIKGIRLRPGIIIDSVQLSSWLSGSNNAATLFGTDQLDEFCIETENLTEALACLGADAITGVGAGAASDEIADAIAGVSADAIAGATSDEITGVTSDEIKYKTTSQSSIQQVAKELGVSVRTLQRLVKSGTGQSPYFWFSLARARKAANALSEYKTLSEAAHHLGYADQAHMSRDMRKWFGKTPSQICIDSEFQDVISEPGYG